MLLRALINGAFVRIPIIGWVLPSFNNEEKKARSNVTMCSPAHRKIWALFGGKPAQCLARRPPFTQPMRLRAGEHLRHLTAEPEQLPSCKQCIPARGSLTGEHVDLDLGNKLAKGMKKKRNISRPSRHLWQNSCLEKTRWDVCFADSSDV